MRWRFSASAPLDVLRPVVLLVALVLTAGCDLLADEPAVTVDGTFEGTVELRGDPWQIRFALSEAEDAEITGSGSLSRTDSREAIPLTIRGIHDHPKLTLSLINSAFYDKDFTGTVSDDGTTISGRLRDLETDVRVELTER